MAEPRRISGALRRAQRLLLGGAIGGHLGAAVVVGVFWAIGGPNAAASAAVAAVVALAFNIIGHAVQVMVSDADPRLILVAALASYTVRVTVLGVVLMLALANADRFTWMDPPAIVWGMVVVVFGWLTAEFWVYSRLRIPVFDPPEDRPNGHE